MTRGRGTASIVASPVLVGAVTTLIVIVSVFLAYNANQGLPFVPTYNIKAQLPGGANLVPGNEVRIGGFRVGVIDTIGTAQGVFQGQRRSIAVARLKLDKTAQPLSVDTGVLVRPRSALGLKYIQLTPGHSKQTLRPGDTIALKNASQPVEFDDLLNTFDARTRQNSQDALFGFGDALAGRGPDINTAIQSLAPFFRYLGPVMANLSDPRTRLGEFFRQIGRTSAQVAPVARINAELFANMADAVIVAEPDGRIVDVNPAACEVLGYAKEELLEIHPWDFVTSASREEILKLMREMRSSWQRAVMEMFFSFLPTRRVATSRQPGGPSRKARFSPTPASRKYIRRAFRFQASINPS